DVVMADPAVDSVVGLTGGTQGTSNTGRMFIALKPVAERKLTAAEVITRLRPKLANVPGATLYLQAIQDIRVGGRLSNALFQFTLQGDDLRELNRWAPRMQRKLQALAALTDVSSDQQNRGLEASVVIDRDTAARLGVTPQMIDDTLYDAFGQRQVSTVFTQLNLYRVILEVKPELQRNPAALEVLYVRAQSGEAVPLSTFVKYQPTTSTLPSAGLGALMALMLCRTEFSIIALIGVVLLIGIVMKNAIMMIDFAIEAEREQKLQPQEAIHQACLLRFRPILMTTLAALFGGLPLALERGTGSELPRPLGIAIVGGLLISQLLTLYTTPVIYLFMERLRLRLTRRRAAPVAVPSAS